MEIELQQAYIKSLEKQVKIKTKIISQMTESQWTDDQDSLGRTRALRAPRGGETGVMGPVMAGMEFYINHLKINITGISLPTSIITLTYVNFKL